MPQFEKAQRQIYKICKIKPKSTGKSSFQSGCALVLWDLICVQVAVQVIGVFAIETTQR